MFLPLIAYFSCSCHSLIFYCAKVASPPFPRKYRRGYLKERKTSHVYLTELVMVLNHKIWQWYQINETVAQVYNDLWKETNLWAQEHLEGEELDYFYEVTD